MLEAMGLRDHQHMLEMYLLRVRRGRDQRVLSGLRLRITGGKQNSES